MGDDNDDKSMLPGLLGFAAGYKAVRGKDASVGDALQGLGLLWAVAIWVVLLVTEPLWTIPISIVVFFVAARLYGAYENRKQARMDELLAHPGVWHLNPDSTHSLWHEGRLIAVVPEIPYPDPRLAGQQEPSIDLMSDTPPVTVAADGLPGTPGFSDKCAAFLELAAEDHRQVWIGYVDAQGRATSRVVEPRSVEGGFVAAYDHLRGEDRTFAVQRITGVADVDADGSA